MIPYILGVFTGALIAFLVFGMLMMAEEDDEKRK